MNTSRVRVCHRELCHEVDLLYDSSRGRKIDKFAETIPCTTLLPATGKERASIRDATAFGVRTKDNRDDLNNRRI